MEPYVHYAGVRLRVTGAGNLNLEFQSLDNIYTDALAPLALATTNAVEPTVLANFTQQRAFLKGSTTDIDAHFRINKISVFVRPIYTGQPQ